MSDPTLIDVKKVEKELASALEADRKYSRENDAKFRAVNQKVATYEEFREIVKASHLNSLDRDDITGRKGKKQPWNPVASSNTLPLSDGGGVDSHHGNGITNSAPTRFSHVQEFVREWRRLKGSPQDQYCFLLNVGGHHLYTLFKVEISMGLLGEFLEVLNQCYPQTEHTGEGAETASKDTEAVVEVLTELSRSSRFGLAVTFLGSSEKRAASELLDKLGKHEKGSTHSAQEDSHETKTLQDLAKLYAVQR